MNKARHIAKNFVQATSVAAAIFYLVSCSGEKVKIGESLSVLDSNMEMSDPKNPDIGQFFDSQIFTKREGDFLKWKLILVPASGYNKTLSEELIKYESTTNPVAFTLDRGAAFFIEFLDVDGFVIHEARAGDRSVVNLKGPEEPFKKDEAAKPVLSKDSHTGEVCYFGEIRSQSDQIEKIDKVRIRCGISETLKGVFVSLIDYQKEKKKEQN